MLSRLVHGSEMTGQKVSGRVHRKRQQVHQRILDVSETLIARYGVDVVTIADITSAADIGHGTLYTHFKNKFEIVAPMIEDRACKFDQRVIQLTSDMEDSAEVLAVSARLMSRLIISDPVWSWFLKNCTEPQNYLATAFGEFSIRDTLVGIESGRFQIPNQKAFGMYTTGALVSVIIQSIGQPNPEVDIDDAVELMLRTFGVPLGEAAKISHQPLPDLPA